jgi:TPR repeat protein
LPCRPGAVNTLLREWDYGPTVRSADCGRCRPEGQDWCADLSPQNIAATQGHPDASFALTAWYLVGSPGVLPQSDTEAYLWAKKAAELGLAKAQYAVGYFTEVSGGTFWSYYNIKANCK